MWLSPVLLMSASLVTTMGTVMVAVMASIVLCNGIKQMGRCECCVTKTCCSQGLSSGTGASNFRFLVPRHDVAATLAWAVAATTAWAGATSGLTTGNTLLVLLADGH